MRVQRRELARQRTQRLIDDRPDRVIRRHPGCKINLTEQAARPPILAPHPPTLHLVARLFPNYHITHPRATFSAAC
jgi:hypothetical protein